MKNRKRNKGDGRDDDGWCLPFSAGLGEHLVLKRSLVPSKLPSTNTPAH
jgi:hypothetical protein